MMMETRQKDLEKEKDLAPGERTPKGGKSKFKSRKGKEAVGVSRHVGADGVDPTALWPTTVVTANNETGLPADQFVPDEVCVDRAGRQLEQELELADRAGRRQQREQEDEGESSHARRQDGCEGAAVNEIAGLGNPATEPSMRDVLEAMKASSDRGKTRK
ncbi:hypothetical protein Bca52824_017695 [Brassica carinata]|uniref:Uncharacterized protein n=1 Tax=Brassica carinata TaxID=52824 RepID=A0A8X8AXQ6_BRACI|nr:hypothetical protein Bca52824_017695 [Brassica carinata]